MSKLAIQGGAPVRTRPYPEYNTIGGYVFGQIGRLPRPGDRVPIGTRTLEVVDMEGRRVRTLRLHAPKPEAEAPVA